MAWLESHQSLGEHPKTKKLCRLLGIPKREAVGTLHLLWWWALDYAEDGDLTRYDALDIAIGADWDKNETEFVDSLVSAGFLDRNETALVIHDWHDYAGKLIERRERNAQRMRDARASYETDTNNERATHVQGTQRARAKLQNRTQPNSTVPTEPTKPNPSSDDDVKTKKKRRNPTDMPEDFTVTDEMRAWARERKGLSDQEIDHRTDRFLNYVEQEGKQYCNWTAAWRNAMDWGTNGKAPVYRQSWSTPDPLSEKPPGCPHPMRDLLRMDATGEYMTEKYREIVRAYKASH
jgi:hypothetical protein